MIAVEVGNEDAGDFTAADFIIDELYLGAFTTIDHETISIHRNDLAGRMTIECRYG